MNINKYINWGELWEEEICLETAKDYNPSLIEKIERFQNDKEVELIFDECHIDDDRIYIFFGETGGENESDTHGWSRDYSFVFDKDFMLLSLNYTQG
ncbi:hypothetical protein C8P64_1951 [Christiangramia gaetbulicola]|uniref:Uncharacterized protein n=1 Tax=Christiangramia gaetbulicola TaxID=703340 RepID=A0A2T6AHX9_9FLAO|nr:hypothetical protein [Christiangramia gaetbulicola]PTX43424.1 hypothetical protein C8P64_1951 [Christiangramia gaetbulicola]